MARLILKLKDKVLSEFLMKKDMTITIGRDPSNDIQLDNPAVSRFHAKIYQQEWPFYVEDLKSTNGTFLNDCFVSWKAPLLTNDRITIGKHTIVFVKDKWDHDERPIGAGHLGADMTIKR